MRARPGHRWFAAFYDHLNASVERGKLGQARREILAGLQGKVIEIGAGTGANFEHYPPGVEVIALEPDPYMLDRARARLAGLGRNNIDLREGPAESLPFPDGAFDSAVSTLVLCTAGDPATALMEIRRVLKPGGRLVFIEHVRGTGFLGRFQDTIRPIWSWIGAGCQLNRRTEDALRTIGFDVAISERIKPMPILPVIIGSATRT